MLTQPTEIPGTYALNFQPFPASVGRQRLTYGLYTYNNPYRKYRQDIREIGFGHLRFGGSLTGQDLGLLAQDGLRASLHVADGAPRDAYSSDEDFLLAAERRAELRLERYPDARYFHVWNEPNFGYMLAGQSPELQKRKAALYAKLLLRISALVRDKRSEAQIIGFDVGRAGSNATDFIRDVYRLMPQVHQAYDILALHPGVDPVPPEADYVASWGSYSLARQVADVRRIWRLLPLAQRRRKPIWFTEGGWDISQEEGGSFPSEPGHTVSPLLQAAYLVRYYALAIRLGVRCVTPFFVVDTDKRNGGIFDDQTGKWRPAATAIQTMIRLLPRPRLSDVAVDGEDGTYAWWISPEEGEASMLMVWNVEGPKRLEVGLPGSAVTVTDMLGVSHEIRSETGLYDLDIGPLPIYVS